MTYQHVWVARWRSTFLPNIVKRQPTERPSANTLHAVVISKDTSERIGVAIMRPFIDQCPHLFLTGHGSVRDERGRAAKLLAIYLKSMIVVQDNPNRLAHVAHPPIDSAILQNISKDKGINHPHKQYWKYIKWTQLDGCLTGQVTNSSWQIFVRFLRESHSGLSRSIGC